jgi:histidine triad (HIT) family protein
MTYNVNNIFAKILRGEIPCKSVYENEFVLAFHDINPKAPVHVLVIPKGEYQSLSDFGKNATSEEISEFFKAVAHLTEDLKLQEKGYRMITNEGLNGRQEVPHFHIHLLGGKDIGPMVCKVD